MAITRYNDKAVERITHIKSHLDGGFKIDQLVHNIENNLGNPRACAMTLARHAEAGAMYAWFEFHDINAMRQWCYTAAKLDQRWYQMEVDTASPGANMVQLLMPLLSNNGALIDWFAQYDEGFDIKRVENHKTHDFWAYQAILALRGEWSRLIERCEKVIADPPDTSAVKKYLVDHHFYLALARSDVDKMCESLSQLAAPKTVHARSAHDSGYMKDLISRVPAIYTKIAWRHGYELKIDSPYIPEEWLPVEPLGDYENHYRFLK